MPKRPDVTFDRIFGIVPAGTAYVLEADGSRYAATVINVTDEHALLGPITGSLVLVEIGHERRWHLFDESPAIPVRVLAESYVAEKFLVGGVDASNLTRLIAAALGRRALITSDDGESVEQIEAPGTIPVVSTLRGSPHLRFEATPVTENILSEGDRFRAASRGGPDPQPCACGGTIQAASGLDPDIQRAVEDHNQTPIHRRWRITMENT